MRHYTRHLVGSEYRLYKHCSIAGLPTSISIVTSNLGGALSKTALWPSFPCYAISGWSDVRPSGCEDPVHNVFKTRADDLATFPAVFDVQTALLIAESNNRPAGVKA